MNPYDELGVSREASPDEIKKAYRKKASQHHPDREGGDQEKFVVIQLSYEILSDPEKRERFDQTGETQEDRKDDPYTIVMQVFLQVSENSDEKRQDLVEETRRHFRNVQRTLRENTRKLRKQGRKWKEVIKRLGVPKESPMKRLAYNNRKKACQDYLEIRRNRIMVKKCLELIHDWTYQTDKPPQREVDIMEEMAALNRMASSQGFFGSFRGG